MKVPVRRCLLDYPIIYIPGGLLTFALVAILSTIWPPEWERKRKQEERGCGS